MTGRIAALTVGGGLSVVTELDPSRQAFLDDHRIDGTPVLPGVMGMEGFAEAARALLPGWRVVALEDVDLLAPFKFYRDEPRTLELRALVRDGGDGTLVADCQLIGRRDAARPGRAARRSLHRARAAGARGAGRARPAAAPRRPTAATVEHDAVYRVYFHGPAYQVLDRAWRDDGARRRRLAGDLPPDHEPAEHADRVAPRLIELCFQTAGVWELGTTGRMALPDARRPRRRGSPAPTRPARCGRSSRQRATATASTPRSSTTTAACACGSRATARSSCPAASTTTRSRRSARRWAERLTRCSDRSGAWRSSTAASPPCGSSMPCASSTRSATSRSG